MAKTIHLNKIVKRVGKRVPEAKLGTTDESLPSWSLANRTAWLEFGLDGTLLLRGTQGGGSTITRKQEHHDSASDTADVIAEFLVEPLKIEE